MKPFETNPAEETLAILVTVTEGRSMQQCDGSLDELERLLDTAGGKVFCRVIQPLDKPRKATFIGSGKVIELAELCKANNDINLILFDDELTPSQISNLEKEIGVRVIDRTMLILDIFALHAVTGEGKLQVEIACLKYTAPRLTGRGRDMSRLGGGIGTRGPGESKLEIDRRRIRSRIGFLEQQLSELEKNRGVKRAGRSRSGLPTAAIIGYTNAGKSTLLNFLTNAGILAEDKLFATLDPTTRILTLPSGNELLLTDTVGFIDRLPTHLIKAFKSTLEELMYADILIMLTDYSEPEAERSRKKAVTVKMIDELGASDKPIIEVYNKCDCAVDEDMRPSDAVCISARTGQNIPQLLSKLEEVISDGKRVLKLSFTYSQQSKLNELHGMARVIDTRYEGDAVIVTAECDARAQGYFRDYVILPKG